MTERIAQLLELHHAIDLDGLEAYVDELFVGLLCAALLHIGGYESGRCGGRSSGGRGRICRQNGRGENGRARRTDRLHHDGHRRGRARARIRVRHRISMRIISIEQRRVAGLLVFESIN